MIRNNYKIFISSTWVPAFPPHLIVVLQFLPQTSYVILSKVGKKERGSRRIEQGGIFTRKVGRIFQRRIEKSQELLLNNRALLITLRKQRFSFHIFVNMSHFLPREQFQVNGINFPVKIVQFI